MNLRKAKISDAGSILRIIGEAQAQMARLGGFTQYVCDEAPSPGVVPVDLSFNQGATIYTLLSALRDIYPNYEIYFDVDGVFHYHPIPTGVDEPIQIDDTLWENIVISEKVDVDFQNIKNYIEVYGRTHDPALFATASSVTYSTSGNIVNLTYSPFSYVDGQVYGFTINWISGMGDVESPKIKINNLGNQRYILNADGTNATIYAETGQEIYYCIQYVENTGGTPYWLWLGHLQAYAVAEDNDPNSPFYTGGSIGVIRLPLYGGEYDNCMTDELAQQRANYELYMHTNMKNTLTISCIPIPWLDVNTLVEYTLNRNGQKNQYLIKSFNYGFNVTDTMSITMMKYYPE